MIEAFEVFDGSDSGGFNRLVFKERIMNLTLETEHKAGAIQR